MKTGMEKNRVGNGTGQWSAGSSRLGIITEERRTPELYGGRGEIAAETAFSRHSATKNRSKLYFIFCVTLCKYLTTIELIKYLYFFFLILSPNYS